MLDDEYDKKIKEAADHYHPAYDDAAWKKMSQLLDEHLPEKKERKRIFFILPSLLLVAVLVWFLVIQNGKKRSLNVAQNLTSTNIPAKPLEEKPGSGSEEKVASSPVSTEISSSTEENKKGDKKLSQKLFSQKKTTNSVAVIFPDKKEMVSSNNNNIEKEKSSSEQAVAKADNDTENKTTSSELVTSKRTNNNDSVTALTEKKSATKNIIDENVPLKNKNEEAKPAIKKSKKTNSGFKNNFGVSISAGPDISGVHANKIGKLTAVFGAGLNYSISHNFGIRSGFYISKKIYSVEGNDYYLQGGNSGYGYLKNVNANCTVYEIPVKVDYNFTRIKNHNWFVSTGLSSYLMKKENYDYYYKTITGSTYSKNWTINNKNKNFFSIISFSGGYQYFLNNQFCIVAEPYVDLPLAGVGEGKVKLNSGGILLTLKVKPFANKAK